MAIWLSSTDSVQGYIQKHTHMYTHTHMQCTHTQAYVSQWMGSCVYHVAMEFVERPSSCCHSNQGTLLCLDGKMSVALFHRTDLLFVEDSVSRFILKSSACNRGQLRRLYESKLFWAVTEDHVFEWDPLCLCAEPMICFVSEILFDLCSIKDNDYKIVLRWGVWYVSLSWSHTLKPTKTQTESNPSSTFKPS